MVSGMPISPIHRQRRHRSAASVLVASVYLSILAAVSPGVLASDFKYDFGTTIFSPQGRLYQVEYASEAVNRAKPAVGICTDEGIVLCALKTIYSKRLQESNFREKISLIDSHVVCTCAGVTGDALVLVKDCQATAQEHFLNFQEPIPLQKLATHLSDVKQAYTQYGGLRPWGVSMLLAGWDVSRGLQLYKTEPSGNFGGFKAVAMGHRASKISSKLAPQYHTAGGSSMGLGEAVRLAASILDAERGQGTDSDLGGDGDRGNSGREEARGGGVRGGVGGVGMEIATLAVTADGTPSAYLYSDEEVERVLGTVREASGVGYKRPERIKNPSEEGEGKEEGDDVVGGEDVVEAEVEEDRDGQEGLGLSGDGEGSEDDGGA